MTPYAQKLFNDGMMAIVDEDTHGTCEDCGELFRYDEMRYHSRDKGRFYCNRCYVPDADDNAEHEYEQERDRGLE